MAKASHFGIILSNRVNKKQVVDDALSGNFPDRLNQFNHQKGVLFSSLAIEKIIEQEKKYDPLLISDRPLHTFSSGERKKMLLTHCINQEPDYLLLDNPFDHLDTTSKKELADSLEEIGKTISIIQLESKSCDLLPFITTHFQLVDNDLPLSDWKENKFEEVSILPLPKTNQSFDLSNHELVRFNKVSVSYEEKPILTHISWQINKGEFWQLVGPNGSGKSTLLSLITGDNPKAYGQDIYLFGRKKGTGESVRDIKKNIGYFSPLITELFDKHHTLEQMLLSGFYDSVGLYNTPSLLQRKIAQQWLEMLNLLDLRKKPFRFLSVSQQRIALIIRAFIKQPPLLILDEPLEGLDEESTSLVVHFMNQLISSTDATMIYVSHRVDSRVKPTAIYELSPSEKGSTGAIKNS